MASVHRERGRESLSEPEAPILWPPDVESWLNGKDPDAGKDWKQEEKGTAEEEMVGWHHRLNGHEFERTLGDSEGQGSPACCNPGAAKSQTRHSNWTREEPGPIDLRAVICCEKLLQSCPTLCDPMDCSLPGSSVCGILQARILEWICHSLLQGIFPTQGLNQHVLHLTCVGRRVLYH